MSSIKKLAGQTVIYGFGQIFPRVLHFIIFTTYLTNRLNDNRADYAVYLDLYAYTAILIVLFSYRMDTALFRFGKKKEDLPKTYNAAFYPLLFSSFLVLCISHLFDLQIATWLTYPDKAYYIRWFGWIIAFDVINLLPFAKMRLEGKPLDFIKYKFANVLLTVLFVLITLEFLPDRLRTSLFPFAQGDIDFIFIANLAASAILFGALMIYHRPTKFNFDKRLYIKMAKYAAPLVIVGVAASINQFFGVPLQKFFLGEEIELNKDRAAVYGAVQKIPALLALFTTAYNYAAEPFFFKNSDKKGSKDLYGEIALVFVMASGVICVGLNSLIDIVKFLIGSNFREGLYLIPILLMAYLFLGIYYNVSIWYKLADKTIYGALISTVGAIITLAGSLMLLPIIGIDASAWVALTCYVVMVIMAWTLGKKHYRIEYPISRIMLHISIIVAFLIAGTWINTIMENTIVIGVFTLILYVSIITLLEKQRIIDIIRS